MTLNNELNKNLSFHGINSSSNEGFSKFLELDTFVKYATTNLAARKIEQSIYGHFDRVIFEVPDKHVLIDYFVSKIGNSAFINFSSPDGIEFKGIPEIILTAKKNYENTARSRRAAISIDENSKRIHSEIPYR